MRVTTSITLDIDGRVTEHHWYEWDGPIALCKGDQTAKQSEILQQQNQQQQMQFNQNLMQLFQQRFGKQDSVLAYLQGKLQPIIDAGGQGMSPEALTAARTTATDQLSTSYRNAQQALQQRQFALGGRDIPSGANDQLNAALAQSEASDKAGAQNQITLQNENLRQANYWNALNSLSGTAAQLNPLGYSAAATGAAESATGAGNSVANLSQAYTASTQSQLLGALGGIAAGAATGAFGVGGAGTKALFGKK